jgi:hypothetical protein
LRKGSSIHQAMRRQKNGHDGCGFGEEHGFGKKKRLRG